MATTRKTPTKAVKKAVKKAAAKLPPPPKAKPAPVPAPAPAAKAPKADKPKKAKMVRDGFTIPKTEYVVLEALKQRAAMAGTPAKKSEILRAGIKALAAMNDAGFAAALASVPAIKTGRPAKD